MFRSAVLASWLLPVWVGHIFNAGADERGINSSTGVFRVSFFFH